MLSAFNISKAYSTRTLFSGLTLNVDAGDRIALIGANGSGKTTLMDILAGRNPDGLRECDTHPFPITPITAYAGR